MENNSSYRQKLVEELIDRDKWADFLKRFIDVLRINIFVINHAGGVVIPPLHDRDRGRYGSQFLIDSFGFNFSGENLNILEEFEQHGSYFEAKDPFDFRIFAIPVKADNDNIVAYLMVGPVILNKRWDNDDYINLASQLKINLGSAIDSINEIRVVSFVTMKAILDLLAEVAKDIVQLNLEKKRLKQSELNGETLSKKFTEAAQDLYATIHFDELLITILDVALSLTKAECGSIMILDDKSKDLTVKVSRGIDLEKAKMARLQIGEGLAGTAAKENQPLIISGVQGDNRVKQYLKRPDIKQSLIIPLSTKDRVFGVLNLHTKKDENKIDDNLTSVKHLSRLISTALHSI